MNLENNKELATNKLILLYIVDKIEIPITNIQIMKIILVNRFMNYFIFQHSLNELCQNNYMQCTQVDNMTYYKITTLGKQTLDYFVSKIPPGIKLRIENLTPEIRKNIKNDLLITSNFKLEKENAYTVECKVQEDDFELIHLKISAGTKSDAKTICNNWKMYSKLIYPEIIESILKKR